MYTERILGWANYTPIFTQVLYLSEYVSSKRTDFLGAVDSRQSTCSLPAA